MKSEPLRNLLDPKENSSIYITGGVIMRTFEELQEIANNNGVSVIDNYHFDSRRIDGLCCDDTIAIASHLENSSQKVCVLAEELAHYYTASGDIIDQSNPNCRKQELDGRIMAYKQLVSLDDLISAHKNYCQNAHEVAEFLGVTDEFLQDTLNYYKSKYGCYTIVGNYIISFDPVISISEYNIG